MHAHMHMVMSLGKGTPPGSFISSELNPAELRAAPQELHPNLSAEAATRKAPLPALQREPQVAPDSSDQEAERLQLLGQQGK